MKLKVTGVFAFPLLVWFFGYPMYAMGLARLLTYLAVLVVGFCVSYAAQEAVRGVK